MSCVKLIGITDYARKHLDNKDLETLQSFIGCSIEESDIKSYIDGGKLYILPDLELTHEVFLITE